MLKDIIYFLGEKSHEDALNIIKNARALVTLTKMYEGQPRVLCEASTMSTFNFSRFWKHGRFFPKQLFFKI